MKNEIDIANNITGLLLKLVSCNDMGDGANHANGGSSSDDKAISIKTRFVHYGILFTEIIISFLTMASITTRLGNRSQNKLNQSQTI